MEIDKLLGRQDIPIDVKNKIKDYFLKYKRMEEAHQELELQMVKTLDNMVDPIHLIDNEFKLIFFNTSFKQWNKELGLDANVIGKTVQEVFPFLPVDVIDEYHQVFKSGETLTTRGSIQVDNLEIFTETLKIPLFERGTVARIITVIRNITRHKQTEKALESSEEKYRTILESIEDGYYEVDLAGNITFFNANISKILGYPENELLGMNYKQYSDKSSALRVFETFNKVYRMGIPSKAVDLNVIKKDGTLGIVESSVSLIVDSTGNPIGFRGIVRDISDRKKAEEALVEVKEKYQMLIEKMEEGVLLEDAEGLITFVNPRGKAIFGYTEEEMLGKHWTHVISQSDIDIAQTEYNKRPSGITSTYEVNIKTKNGFPLPVIVTSTPIFTKDGDFDGVLCVFTDITERKQIQDTLKQVKLEEERYHAMLSHFVNNDLQIIINNLEMMMLKFNSSMVMDDMLAQRIMDIASRSSKTIDNVNKIFEVLQLPFTCKEKHHLLASIDDVVFELQSILPFLSDVIINRESLDKEILGDKYLKNVFYELILFSQSSKEEYMVEDATVTIGGCQNPPYFCVSIRDSHSQPISEEIGLSLSEKITEEWEYQGHFIGIALASVIMQHYGGSLKIKALKPKGNEFQLHFPIDLLSF